MSSKSHACLNNIMVTVVVLGLLTFVSACSEYRGNAINPLLLGMVHYSMSEKAVVDLLGKPVRVENKYYRIGEKEKARLLHYNLADGRKWTIVMNEKDELIGSGETGTGKERNNSRKNRQVRKSAGKEY